jgi:hypothetical protein
MDIMAIRHEYTGGGFYGVAQKPSQSCRDWSLLQHFMPGLTGFFYFLHCETKRAGV